MTVREVCRLLHKHGWQFVRHKGSHRQYRKGQRLVTVAGAHPGKEATKDVVKLVKRLEGR